MIHTIGTSLSAPPLRTAVQMQVQKIVSQPDQLPSVLHIRRPTINVITVYSASMIGK